LLITYCEKVEIQSEKYISSLQDSDDDDVEQIIDEDYSLCAKAMECCVDLEEYREYLPKSVYWRKECKNRAETNIQMKM